MSFTRSGFSFSINLLETIGNISLDRGVALAESQLVIDCTALGNCVLCAPSLKLLFLLVAHAFRAAGPVINALLEGGIVRKPKHQLAEGPPVKVLLQEVYAVGLAE